LGMGMKRKILSVIFIVVLLTVFVVANPASAQMQSGTQEYNCESCPMKVGAQAQEHLQVYDGNGTRHWVDCIGCALKLLNTYDTLHIETYCDWYGPNSTITIDISRHGASTTITPETALLLIGGGCTGNRVAYNQTAADNLLANGYSKYTMMMMQQALPSNTNTTTFSARALTFASAAPDIGNQNVYVVAAIAIVGATLIIISLVVYKKISKQGKTA
jgi:hypothetical protein